MGMDGLGIEPAAAPGQGGAPLWNSLLLPRRRRCRPRPARVTGVVSRLETVAFPVPDWKGTRPSFQYSLHRLDAAEELTHHAFLDLGGIADGSTAFREAVAESTPADRRRQIEQELLDTLDMVRMWEVLCGAVVSCSENKRPGLLWPPISEAIEKSPRRILFHEGIEQPTALAGKVEQAGPHGK